MNAIGTPTRIAIVVAFAILTTTLVSATTESTGSTDTTKNLLHMMKDLACGTVELIDGAEGPIEDKLQLSMIVDQVTETAEITEQLLRGSESPVRTTPDMWLYWAPPSAGTDLEATAYSACQAACKALEDYCESIENGDPAMMRSATRELWEVQGLLCHILNQAGAEGRP